LKGGTNSKESGKKEEKTPKKRIKKEACPGSGPKREEPRSGTDWGVKKILKSFLTIGKKTATGCSGGSRIPNAARGRMVEKRPAEELGN